MGVAARIQLGGVRSHDQLLGYGHRILVDLYPLIFHSSLSNQLSCNHVISKANTELKLCEIHLWLLIYEFSAPGRSILGR